LRASYRFDLLDHLELAQAAVEMVACMVVGRLLRVLLDLADDVLYLVDDLLGVLALARRLLVICGRFCLLRLAGIMWCVLRVLCPAGKSLPLFLAAVEMCKSLAKCLKDVRRRAKFD